MMADEVLYDVRDRVAVMTLNRPEYAQRAELGDDVRAGRRVRPGGERRRVAVLVLAGAGKHFCGGHDIGTPGRDVDQSFDRQAVLWWDHVGKAGADARYAREMEVYLGMCRRWREMPKPVIAMVQGACIAGGLMLAWVCDLIVAADDAFFADPVVRMGIPGVEYFAHPWVLGPRLAKEFLFTGGRFSAERAYELGMVNRVVPRGVPGSRDVRAGREDRRDAAVRAGAGQEGGQPVRGPHGPAAGHGLGVRPAPPRARAQRRGRRRLAGRPGRPGHEGFGRVTDPVTDAVTGAVADAVTDAEQRDLRDAVRGLLASGRRRGRSGARGWWRCREVGVAGLAIPERYGGAGGGAAEVGVVMEELGRGLTPSPMLGSAVLAAQALLGTGDEAACERLLPAIADGVRDGGPGLDHAGRALVPRGRWGTGPLR